MRDAVDAGSGVMVERRAAYAAVMLLGLVGSLMAADGAGAQPYYYRIPYYGEPRLAPDGLPLNQIMRAVRVAGYAPIGVPVRRGSTYVVVANAPGRGPVRVVVNAYMGEIVGVTSATLVR